MVKKKSRRLDIVNELKLSQNVIIELYDIALYMDRMWYYEESDIIISLYFPIPDMKNNNTNIILALFDVVMLCYLYW